MGSGLLEANRTGGTVKRVHCGWAAHAGVVAADLARHGLTGPPTVVEGRFGFLQAFCGDRADIAAVTERLGEHWELPGIFFKPYPCNHFTHAGIDAALELRARGIRPDDIGAIELGVPGAVLKTIGQPPEEKARPRSGYHAAFSGPYTVATALLGGGGLGVFHEDFTDDRPGRTPAGAGRQGPVRRRRACDEIFPHQFPAVLTARLDSGESVTERIVANRGGPDRPLGDDEVAEKFRTNAVRSVPEQDVPAVVDAVRELRGGRRVTDLMDRTGALL